MRQEQASTTAKREGMAAAVVPRALNPEIPAIPSGLPAWITEEFIEETIRVWQPASKNVLTQDDAIEIIMNMSGLLDVLLDKDAG